MSSAADFTRHPSITDALTRLDRVGLSYLALGQSLDVLSGGERQRLKLAKELAAPANLYLFDEPTTGLHGSDIHKLLALFDGLIDDTGCSLVIVEHNLDVLAHADQVIDLGPGAGSLGGVVLFEGSPRDMVRSGVGATGDALRGYLPSTRKVSPLGVV